MNKYKKPKINPADFEHNPLAGSDFKILINKIVDGKKLELVGGDLVPSEVELERDSYSKVYIKPENRRIIAQLSPSSKSLFLWVVYEMEQGRDYLWVNKRRYMEENDITSINTYKKAMAELVRLTFLCASIVKDVYWINPRLMFCGSRINKYRDHLILHEPKKKEE